MAINVVRIATWDGERFVSVDDVIQYLETLSQSFASDAVRAADQDHDRKAAIALGAARATQVLAEELEGFLTDGELITIPDDLSDLPAPPPTGLSDNQTPTGTPTPSLWRRLWRSLFG